MSTRKGDGVPAWRRVLARCEYDPDSGCILWTGPVEHGYARVFVDTDRRHVQIHRVVYEELVGEVPQGLDLGHTCHDDSVAAGICAGGDHCRHRRCVRHVVPQTRVENVMASAGLTAENARKTACPQGHPYDEKNTYIDKKGGRICRACRARHKANHRRRHPKVS